MNEETEQDIRTVFGNSLDIQTLNDLIEILRAFWSANQNALLPIKTRNDKGEPLGYFAIFHESVPEEVVILAGGLEENIDENNRSFPIVRIDEHNHSLHLVAGLTFLYRKRTQKSNRICVKLRRESIDVLPILLQAQLEWFNSSYVNEN